MLAERGSSWAEGDAQAIASKRTSLTLGEIFRSISPAKREAMGLWRSQSRRVVFERLSRCRTAALGGHVERCTHCGHHQNAYNSCRDRHCPTCLGQKSAQWLRDRSKELLPVPYFHVVFTLPEEVSALALGNKKVMYEILFAAASETLIEVAGDSKRLGVEAGFLAILHTWSQTLMHHPHLHCVVPGGGLSSDRKQWKQSKRRFFLPVKVLSRVYRGKFLALLKTAWKSGRLRLDGRMKHLEEAEGFEMFRTYLRSQNWVVYVKPPFGSAEQVLKYLAAYTHRVAISNRRLVSSDDKTVTFRYRDRKEGGQKKTMTLEKSEFVRRFLLHVLPRRFQRIRHYGFLSNAVRSKRLTLIRGLLGEVSALNDEAVRQLAVSSKSEAKVCVSCGGQCFEIIGSLGEMSIISGRRDTS